MDQQELINEIQLLHENKAELIETMQEIGIAVTEQTPLCEIAELMKEAGGQSCIVKIATVEESESGEYRHRFFSIEEWNEMDSSLKMNYPRIGVLLIAEGKRLIIAKDYATNESGGFGMKWSMGSASVTGLTNFGSDTYGMTLDYDSRGNTEKILKAAEGLAEGYMIAPQCAHEYRGCLNDPTNWCLSAMGHLLLMAKYREQIEAAMAIIGGMPFQTNSYPHWSSTQNSSTTAWVLYFTPFYITALVKSNNDHKNFVRPVAELD